jgi:hypothetical protein
MIDKRKLCFLQKLCQMPNDCLTKHIFDMRLNIFMLKGAKHQQESVPDICKILVKYGLFKYLNDYVQFSKFPTKWTWKNIIRNSINSYQDIDWETRIESDPEFCRFRSIHFAVSPSR